MITIMTEEEKKAYIDEAYTHGDFDDWLSAHYGMFGKDFEKLDVKIQVYICGKFYDFLNRD